MSIVNKIESISNHLTDAYNSLENIGVDLTNIDKNIENLSTQIESVYSDLPKVVDENTEITLSPTKKGKMELILKGNTSQDGTPTPDSPVNVNVVSGDNNIVVEGKNLLNNSKYNDGTYYSYSSGMIEYNQKDTRSASQISDSETITLQPGTYTIKIFHNTGYSHSIQFLTYSGNTISNKNGDTGTFTLTEETTMFIKPFIGLPNNAVLPFNFNIQIEKGSTATTYEPHQGKEFPLDLPVENLFDKNNAEKYTGFTNGSDYKVNYNTVIKSIIIPCKENTTYTVSKINGGNYDRFNIASFTTKPTTGTIASKYVGDNSLTSLTITTGPNDTYIMVLYYHTSETVYSENDILDSIQIEKGSKANAYTPFGTNPIELCKIGDYQDRIYKDSGKWYKHSVINKIVLDGINYLLYGNGGSANDYWEYNRTGVTGGIDAQDSVKTNYFNQTTNSRVVILSNGGLYLRFPKNMGIDISTNTLLNNWFLTHNIEVYYVLYTPTDIEITDPILIQQLENIYNSVKSYNNQTNIYQTNSNLPFIIEASALKKND